MSSILDSGYGLSEQRLMGKARAYEYNHSHPFNQELRNDIIQRMFAVVGEQCWIEPPIHVAYGTHTTIGDNFYANFNPGHPVLCHTQQQFSLP